MDDAVTRPARFLHLATHRYSETRIFSAPSEENSVAGVITVTEGRIRHGAVMKIAVIAKWALWIVVAVLAVGVFNFSVNRLKHTDPMVLTSYDVPPEIAEEVHSALSGALSVAGKNGTAVGRVTVLPNGRLLVAAPPEMQAGVRRILRDIADYKPGATPTIGFEVWVVKATTGSAPAASSALNEIEPALAAIGKNQGPLNFELLEKLSTNARPDKDTSNISGALTQVQLRATLRKINATESTVAAKLALSVSAGPGVHAAIEAQAELRPGELLVLGQSAVGNRDASKANAQLYYIVRATL
jgi:hypothetical protein